MGPAALPGLTRDGVRLASGEELPPPEGTPTTPIIEMSSGYFVRARHLLPRQARSAPWRFHQNHARDLWTLRLAPVRERHLLVTAGPGRSSGTLRWMRRVAQATMPGWSDSPGVH